MKIEAKQLKTLQGSHILLAEDNKMNQEIVLGLLQESKIIVDIAQNGAVAVEMFKSNPSKYELILMDLQMPVMGGIEATKHIREIDQDIPIIALTANAMLEDIKRTKAAGMQEHLNKPIEPEKLYATLLHYISKKVEITTQSSDNQEERTPIKLANIDTDIGLSHMNNNKKLYHATAQEIRS